tara:strand:+ start:2150 stop:2731 length:582 start_codon:yes stop_codon:yes gene_type:complete
MRDVFELEGVGATDECFFAGHAVLWIKSGDSSSGTNPSFGTARAFPAMASVPFVSTRIVASSSLRASSLNRRQETFPCRASARSHNRVLPRLRATDAETTGDGDGEAVAEEDTPEVRVTGALQEFADAGFPSEEGDAVDVVSRTKAMNGAVEDLNSLMDSELEVLGKAFDLLEKLGIKGLAKPPTRGDAKTDN